MDNSVAPCNHTSVGMLVERGGCLLLIKRADGAGFAPPAGHVDPGETYREAAARELVEEVGLTATALRLVLDGRRDNRCRRPGGTHHVWEVYETSGVGEVVRSEDETRSVIWVGRGTLRTLTNATRAYLAGDISEADWQRSPGLEPVWLDMLTALERIVRPNTHTQQPQPRRIAP